MHSVHHFSSLMLNQTKRLFAKNHNERLFLLICSKSEVYIHWHYIRTEPLKGHGDIFSFAFSCHKLANTPCSILNTVIMINVADLSLWRASVEIFLDSLVQKLVENLLTECPCLYGDGTEYQHEKDTIKTVRFLYYFMKITQKFST